MVERNDWRKGGIVSSKFPTRMYVCVTTMMRPHHIQSFAVTLEARALAMLIFLCQILQR